MRRDLLAGLHHSPRTSTQRYDKKNYYVYYKDNYLSRKPHFLFFFSNFVRTTNVFFFFSQETNACLLFLACCLFLFICFSACCLSVGKRLFPVCARREMMMEVGKRKKECLSLCIETTTCLFSYLVSFFRARTGVLSGLSPVGLFIPVNTTSRAQIEELIFFSHCLTFPWCLLADIIRSQVRGSRLLFDDDDEEGPCRPLSLLPLYIL